MNLGYYVAVPKVKSTFNFGTKLQIRLFRRELISYCCKLAISCGHRPGRFINNGADDAVDHLIPGARMLLRSTRSLLLPLQVPIVLNFLTSVCIVQDSLKKILSDGWVLGPDVKTGTRVYLTWGGRGSDVMMFPATL